MLPRALFPFVILTAACGSTISAGDGEGGSGGDEPSSTASGPGATGGTTGTGTGVTTGTGGAPPSCDPPSSPQTFEIGTGETCFERIADGAEIPMMQGPQGGYHLWVAVGCADCQSPAHIRFGVDDPSTGMPIANTAATEQFVDLKGDVWPQRAGLIDGLPGLSWDPEYDPPLPKGTPIRLWLQVLDAGSAVIHEDAIDLTIGDTVVWDPCAENPNHELCGFG